MANTTFEEYLAEHFKTHPNDMTHHQHAKSLGLKHTNGVIRSKNSGVRGGIQALHHSLHRAGWKEHKTGEHTATMTHKSGAQAKFNHDDNGHSSVHMS